MSKNKFLCTALTFSLTVFFFFLNQNVVLAIGENNTGLNLLTSKYPPHDYEVVILERKEEVANTNILKSTFKGPGVATVNFTGSFVGTVRFTGGVTIGGMLCPGMLNTTGGYDKTKSISLSQAYAVKMLNPEVYILVAQPIYEYSRFYIRNKRTGNIVDCGHSERPIGLWCTHYTEDSDEKVERDIPQIDEVPKVQQPKDDHKNQEESGRPFFWHRVTT